MWWRLYSGVRMYYSLGTVTARMWARYTTRITSGGAECRPVQSTSTRTSSSFHRVWLHASQHPLVPRVAHPSPLPGCWIALFTFILHVLPTSFVHSPAVINNISREISSDILILTTSHNQTIPLRNYDWKSFSFQHQTARALHFLYFL